MGFGSGGGGFTPSPNNVPGSTITGTDKDTDVHEFTGSVDITGSLLINGVQITQNGGGGGGGSPGGSNSQVQYNDGGAFGGASSLVYDDVNNHVGIGVSDPDVILEVLDTSTQQKWSYDANSFATLTVADGGDTTIATSENGNLTIDSDDLTLVAAGGQVKIQRPGSSDRLQFDVSTSTALIDNPTNNDIAFRLGSGLKEIARFDQSEGALLMSGTVGAYPQGNAAIHFRDTATKINSPAANRLTLTAPTLEVTGTLSYSGSFGASAIQNLNVAGGPVLGAGKLVNAVDGNTVIDITGLANNAFYSYGIADGTFAGQQKNIIFKQNNGGTINTANSAEITGSNIDVFGPGLTTGQVVLSGSDPGGGYQGFTRGTAQLIWDGSKWQVLGLINATYNSLP